MFLLRHRQVVMSRKAERVSLHVLLGELHQIRRRCMVAIVDEPRECAEPVCARIKGENREGF